MPKIADAGLDTAGGSRAAKAAAGGGAATKEEPSPAEAAFAGGKPGEFGPSPAAVRFPDGERGAKRAAKELFGRDAVEPGPGVHYRCPSRFHGVV